MTNRDRNTNRQSNGAALPVCALALFCAGALVGWLASWLAGALLVVASVVVAAVSLRKRTPLRPVAVIVLVLGAAAVVALAAVIAQTMMTMAEVNAALESYGA